MVVRPDTDTVGAPLGHACRLLCDAERTLGTRPPTLAQLYAGVDGAIEVATALAELVSTVIRQAPAALDTNPEPQVLRELLADLRAMHGCLTTGTLLLAPARDDLRQSLTADPDPRQDLDAELAEQLAPNSGVPAADTGPALDTRAGPV